MGLFGLSSSSSSRHHRPSNGHHHRHRGGPSASSSSPGEQQQQQQQQQHDNSTAGYGDGLDPNAVFSFTADSGHPWGSAVVDGGEEHGAAQAAGYSEPYYDDQDDHDDQDDQVDPCYPSPMSRSVLEHVYEAGLQFHGYKRSAAREEGSGGDGDGHGEDDDGEDDDDDGHGRLYALPNDDVEQNRDDMKHAMATTLMGGALFYAPVHDRLAAAGAAVYDLGTGTGIWAIELAERFPRALVRGVDLSPIQPKRVPRNAFFAVDDFEAPDWPFAPAAFDFVHMRFALWAVDDRAALLARILRHLKPGGYVEFQELVPKLCYEGRRAAPAAPAAPAASAPGVPPAPNALADFVHYVALGLGRSPRLAGGDRRLLEDTAARERVLARELRRAGFRGVRTAALPCPLGPWPPLSSPALRRCGRLLQHALHDGLRGWAARPLGTTAGGLGWTPLQIEMFLIDVRRAIDDTAARAYFPLQVIYAQKPE